MKFYKIEGEHVQGGFELLDELDGEQIEVMFAGRDPVFDSHYVVVIFGYSRQAEKVRDMMWERNGGAWAVAQEITDEQYEAML